MRPCLNGCSTKVQGRYKPGILFSPNMTNSVKHSQSEAAYLKNKAMLYHNCSLKQGTCAVWYELKTANQTTHKSTNKCNKVITVYEQNVRRTRQAAYLLVFFKSRLKTSLKCSESLLFQTKEWMKKKDKTICYIAEKHRPDVNTQVSYLLTCSLSLSCECVFKSYTFTL